MALTIIGNRYAPQCHLLAEMVVNCLNETQRCHRGGPADRVHFPLQVLSHNTELAKELPIYDSVAIEERREGQLP